MINLSKGATLNINLSKSSGQSDLLFGVNWGMVKMGWLGPKKAVDLDASCSVFDKSGREIERVCFSKLKSTSLSHSGDDRSGDADSDEDDNETITVKFDNLPAVAHSVVFYVNSFCGEKFDKIPYAGIRLYEGQVNTPSKVIAKMDIANDRTFVGAETMIMGKMVRTPEGGWLYEAIGDAVSGINRIEPTVKLIQQQYL